MAKKPDIVVTRSEFAELFDVTPQSVSLWVQAGMPARVSGKRGQAVQIELSAAVPWALRRIERSGTERERLTSERADKLAIENAETRRNLVHAHHVRQAVENMLASLTECIEPPEDLAEQIAGTDDPARIRSILMDWTRGVRSLYADRLAQGCG